MDAAAVARNNGHRARIALACGVLIALLGGLFVPLAAAPRPKTARGFSVSDATVTEGNAGSTVLVFTVSLTGSIPKTASVRYTTAGGTASAPTDFAPASGVLSFPKGVSSRQVAVTVFGDLVDEGASETMTLSLSQATRTKIIRAQGTGTITDDDAPPSMSIEGASAPEGEPGADSVLAFPVRLDRASGLTVTAQFSTSSSGPGAATAGSDYVATAAGTVTFLPGQTFALAQVTVLGDTVPNEADETLTVTLSNAVNAQLGTSMATGTIVDNDPLTTPNVAIADRTNVEAATFTFPITISPAPTTAFEIRYDVLAGTATTPADLPPVAGGTITVAAGQPLVNLEVETTNDALHEASETFFVNLRLGTPNGGASIVDGQAVGTITDNDDPPSITAVDTEVSEGDSTTATNFAFFPVRLSAVSGVTATVAYTTTDGTALAGTHYTTRSGTLTFAPGVVEQVVAVPILGNVEDDANRTFTLQLSGQTAATLADGSATATILDDEATETPAVSVDDPTITEADAGSSAVLAFTVTLSDFSDDEVGVRYTVSGPGVSVASTLLTFEPGETQRVVAVSIPGDDTVEADATYTLTLATPTNATILKATGIGTVVDNDVAAPPNTVSVADATVTEGDVSPTVLQFVVSLAAKAAGPLSVDYATAGWTAFAGEDFQHVEDTLHFDAGEQAKTVLVVVPADVDEEATEQLLLNLTAPSDGLEIDRGQAVGTILDDDDPDVGAGLSMTIGDAVVQEAATPTTASFLVSLSEPAPAGGIPFSWSTAEGTADDGSDYTGSSAAGTIAAGAQSATISISILGDASDEAATEQFFVNLSTSAAGVTVARAQGIGTILDNESLLPIVSIGDVTVHNGETPGTVIVTIPVTLSGPSPDPITVTYSIPSPTGGDPITGQIVVPAGQTSASVAVEVVGDLDTVSEGAVTLVDAVGANLDPSNGASTPTIVPVVSIDEVVVTEGEQPGTSIVVVTVTVDEPSDEDVTVVVTVPPAVDGADPVEVVITIPAGQTSGTGQVVVEGDPEDVADVEVAITDVTGGVPSPTDATATPVVDDLPIVTIDDVVVTEGEEPGTSIVEVDVSLDEPSTEDVVIVVTVPPATPGGTPTTIEVTIPAGETTGSGQAVVPGTPGDVADEDVTITDVDGAVISPSGGSATPTVVDVPIVSIDEVTVTPGPTPGTSTVVVDVSLDEPADEVVTVVVTVPPATPGGDPTTIEITIPAGQTTGTGQATVPGTPAQVIGAGEVAITDVDGGVTSPSNGSATPVAGTTGGTGGSTGGSTGGTGGSTGGTGGSTGGGAAGAVDRFTRVATGYRMVASDGGIFTFGDAPFFGSTGDIRLNRPIVGMATTPSGDGYWLVATDGGIFTFGDANFHGSTGALRLNRPIVGMETTPSGNGYWLVADDGGIFAFGDAAFHGSTGDLRLNRPIVGMETTPTGNGYWLVATDGGIFAFGDATFFGSTGDIRLNQPIVGMAASPSGNGYRLVATDGGIFAFGDASFLGSTGDIKLNKPIVGMAASPTGAGYWLVATDGGIFTFGDAAFLGSTGDIRLNQPINGMAPVVRSVRTN